MVTLTEKTDDPPVPLLDEDEVVEAVVESFANGKTFPAFVVPGNVPLPIGKDPGFIEHHRQFVADLAVIAEGGPARALKEVRKRVAADADLVPVKLVPRTEDGRRRRRARVIEAPNVVLALAYVLDLIARGEYRRRLTRCEHCGRFFFQDPGKRRPYKYCPGGKCGGEAHKLANPQRAVDTRERKRARDVLINEHRVRRAEAANLVKGKKGLKADEIVKQALTNLVPKHK
jgi:hypothetical protein